MNISFSPPDISELEIHEVAEALRSGWITTGPRTKQLEKNCALWLGTPKCVCLNSQTACAEMTLRLLGVGSGDECITSAYTYTASASVVCHVGAVLKLVDTQADSFEMDYDALEAAVTERTKVIIPVDLGGVPCDYERIFEIVEKKRILFRPSNELQRAIGRVVVMADTAHAFGARWYDRMIGNVADFSCFSWHAVKNFTTAEGGCVTWRHIEGIDDEELYHQYQIFSLHGQSKDALAKTQCGSWEYDILGPWYKCNMTDVAASIGLKQLERYPAMLARRKNLIERYDKVFRSLDIEVLCHYTETYQSSGHLYITRIPGLTENRRNEVILNMAEKGIACNVHYKPLPMHTAYRKMGFHIEDFPNAYAHFANEITLPLHTGLTDEMADYVIEWYTRQIRELRGKGDVA